MVSLFAMTTAEQGGVLLLVAALAAPIAGYMFARSGAAWRSIGKGPLAIEQVDPDGNGPDDDDPEVQATEVRQMVEARAERQRRRGERPLDVEAEVERRLADFVGSG